MPHTPSLSLECVHLVSAGSDHIQDSPIYTSSQVPITTSSGIHGRIIGEWVIMTSLIASHKYSILQGWQNTRTWDKCYLYLFGYGTS